MEAIHMFTIAFFLAVACAVIYAALLHNSRVHKDDVEWNSGVGKAEGKEGTILTQGDFDLPQPPDVTVLGRSAWTLIHTMAVRYPETPSPEDRRKMNAFLAALADFYPCGLCASHLQAYLRDHPADVSSRSSLRQWLCDLHNSVNKKLKKPAFNCELVHDRWGGPPTALPAVKDTHTSQGCGSGFCTRRMA